MAIEFRCPTCSKLLRTKDDTAGKQAKCPECGTVIDIPAPGAKPTGGISGAEFAGAAPRPMETTVRVPAGSNPYESPLTTSPAMGEDVLATRGSRLLGAIVDGLLYLVCAIPAVAIGFSSGLLEEQFGQIQIQGLAMLSTLPLAIINWVLITRSGQSIGKKVVGTRIVNADDLMHPGFVRAVVMRNWIPLLIDLVPCVGAIFSLVDVLWIFGEERRCIHDLIAQTRVVKAELAPTVIERTAVL